MEWNQKRIRLFLGIMMMYAFIAMALFIRFYIGIVVILGSTTAILGLFSVWYMWLPNIMLISLIYVLLTKVFKYEKGEKKK